MWYKLYIRVGLDGMCLSSGNFAVMYFNSTTYDWIIDDHESGEIFTRSDIVDTRKNTLEYVTANWCDNILMVAVDLIMHEKGYNLCDYEQRRIKKIMEVKQWNNTGSSTESGTSCTTRQRLNAISAGRSRRSWRSTPGSLARGIKYTVPALTPPTITMLTTMWR